MTRRRLVVLLAVAVAVAAPVLAWAYWSAVAATGGHGAAVAASVNQGAAPIATANGTSVKVAWGASTLSDGHAVDGYSVKRYAAGSGVVEATGSACSGTITATTCTESVVPPGQWQYTVTPVIGTAWRGTESVKSGAVTIGLSSLTLSKTVFGAPLPQVVTGSLSGFAPLEGVSYRLDAGTPLTGSPSRVGLTGAATITSLTIPDVTDGPHTVYAIGGLASSASAGILIDTTPPVASAEISPSPNAAGWNAEAVELTLSADDGSGSGVDELRYTTDGSDPTTSPTAQVYSSAVSISATTTVKYVAVDDAGNSSAVQTQPVRIDMVAPVNALTLSTSSGDAVKSGATVYYRGVGGGSFTLTNALTDTGGSGPASSGTAALAGTSTGWTHASSLVGTPAGGPYVSAPFSWAAGTTSSPTETVTGSDTADNAVATTLSYIDDSAPPTGGTVDATGLTGTGGRYSRSTTLGIGFTKGTDAAAGLAATGARLFRAAAPLSSTDGVVDGSCGTYGTATQVGADDPDSPVTDVVPSLDQCYRYEYRVPDQLGNLAVYTSPDVKVEPSPAFSLAPGAGVITPVSGVAAQSVSGSTVYYNPAQSGSFNVDAAAIDHSSGVASMTFPALGGFAGGGVVTTPFSGTSFRSTYSWSNNTASASPDGQALLATNGAGATATTPGAFSVVKDGTGPSGGSVDATGLGGTGGRYSTSKTLSIAFTKGTDGGAGLSASTGQLLRASATLGSTANSNGACGVYSANTVVAITSSPKSDVVSDHVCYRYQYVVTDKVGNATTYTSPDIKVDTTVPAAPTLTFSAFSNTYWSTGANVYYRSSADAGSFTATGATTDAYAGIASYAFPAFPSGWSSTPGALGVNTYSWSSAGPGAPGSQNVTATTNAGLTSLARSFTLVADDTAPATGSVSYTNGYVKSASVAVTFAKGTDLGSGVKTTSGLIQRSSAPLVAGACGTFGAFATVSTNPTTSPFTDTTVTGNCYRYQYLVSDNVGNQTTYTSPSIVKVDTTVPVHALSLVNASGAIQVGTVLYYKGNAAGSFQVLDTMTDAASGPASATFPAVTATGWTHAAETVSTPAGGPFTSSTISWTANPSTPTTFTVTGLDNATNIGSLARSISSDITAPSGGSVTYTNGVVPALSVPVTTANGTDTKSGLDLTSGVLQRDQTTLTTATEVCGTFPGTFATNVTLTAGADTGVTSGSCYKYRYKLSDNLGNQVIYTSTSVAKVDTTGPRITVIASKQSGGVTTGNGQLQVGDQLILTFNQSLATASVPTSFTGASESRTTGTVQLTIPGLTSGALNTGSTAYLASTGAKSASFDGTAALVNSATTSTVTIIVTALSGDATAIGAGALVFQPAATIKDLGGNAAGGPFTTAVSFKLF